MSQKCVVIRTKLNENGNKCLQFLMLFSGEGELPTFDDVKDLYHEMEEYSWVDGDLLYVHIISEVVVHESKDRLSNKLIWVNLKKSIVALNLNKDDRFLLYYGIYRHSRYSSIYPIFRDILDEVEDTTEYAVL